LIYPSKWFQHEAWSGNQSIDENDDPFFDKGPNDENIIINNDCGWS
jgi:hypothetical protein